MYSTGKKTPGGEPGHTRDTRTHKGTVPVVRVSVCPVCVPAPPGVFLPVVRVDLRQQCEEGKRAVGKTLGVRARLASRHNRTELELYNLWL